VRTRVATIGLALAVLGLAPAAAQAAYVTAVDTSVRPAEGSPWSKGTLFQGQGFQVGATTGNGWAWGRAKGEAERCGWVLIGTLNSTTRTDTTCGSPKSEPLEDSAHVPGGGASETWYVTCQDATLFGNYGGAAGNLRSASGTVTYGQAVGWRYTTGNGYAASIDGPTGTPRFVLRSCISRTPPGAGGPGASTSYIGPPPWRILDEEGLFALFGPGQLATASAFASAGKPRVARTRVTIRLAQGNIVLANGLHGDRFTSAGVYCKGWVRGTIDRGGRPFHGWIQTSALTRKPKRTKRDCNAPVRFDDRIAFVNAPFRSITWLRSMKLKGKKGSGGWATTGAASQARLRRDPATGAVAGDCGVYMNYVPGAGLQDQVTPTMAAKLFKRPEMSRPTEIIGYRYTTPGGDAALVSLKTGFKKGPHGGKNVGLWGFVKRDCVVPLKTYSARSHVSQIYQTEIRICDAIRPSRAVARFNARKKSSSRLKAVAPCKLPNAATKPGKPAPDSPASGWRVGTLRLGG
jgi:hypothetical protein